MSKAICCDRCGKFKKISRLYDKDDTERWRLLDGGGLSVSDPIGLDSEPTLLCPSCTTAFGEFMMPVETKNV